MAAKAKYNGQAGVVCPLCKEKIKMGEMCMVFDGSGWSYHMICWNTRASRHYRGPVFHGNGWRTTADGFGGK